MLDNNGVLTVAVYDRGLWDTLKNENIHELDMGNVSYPSPEERKQIEQKAGNIYKDIVSTLGQNNFDIRNNIKPDKYGNYVIQIRKKEQPAQQKPAQQQQPIQQQQQYHLPLRQVMAVLQSHHIQQQVVPVVSPEH